MKKIFKIFIWFACHWSSLITAADNPLGTVAPIGETMEILPTEITHTSTSAVTHKNETLSPNIETLADDEELPLDLIIPVASKPGSSNTFQNKFYFPPIPLELLENFNPIKLVKPIHEKLLRIKEHLSHPNYGGVQFLNPQHIWDKLQQNGNNFLTGINGAILGFANLENHDYPFPYRRLKRNLEKCKENQNCQ